MLFNSFAFFAFFAIVVLIHFTLPQKWRVWFLLLTSYFYCMQFRWEFGLLLALQTLIQYVCGWRIGLSKTSKEGKLWVGIAATLSLLILGYYKYFNFFNDSFRKLFESQGLNYMVPHLNIILPIGISFYTFQTLGYSIDVYRKKCEPELHIGRFALFASFFPQLASGPIGRAPKLLPQFRRETRFDIERVMSGLQLVLWGLFKKVVIADRLSLYVNQMYGDPGSYSGVTLLLASYFFAIQIYCDFSGYTDIAIGVAKILDYDLMQNFNLPYFSHNISEFWKRWHISLTSWFRDYLYIPLGGNRVSSARWWFNIMAIFLVSGLWHGASWTFIIWGALHGTYYFIESLIGKATPKREKDYKPFLVIRMVQIVITFHAVALAWVFFRAATFDDALTIVHKIFCDFGHLYLGPSQITTLLSIGFILLLFSMNLLERYQWASLYFSPSRFPAWMRVVGYAGLAILIALFGITCSNFIYLQF